MNLRAYFCVYPQACDEYLRRSIDNKPSGDRSVYFLPLYHACFNRYLRRKINNKSPMNLREYLVLFSWACKEDLTSNIDNKSSMDLWSDFLTLLVAFIYEGIQTIGPRWVSRSISCYFPVFNWYVIGDWVMRQVFKRQTRMLLDD